MLISIIIPCYNEKNTILKILNKVKNQKINKQIIVIDDSSTDGTTNILKKNFKKKGFKLISHKKNLGKGAAIKSAKKFIKGDIVIIQDADLEYDPNEYPNVIGPILNGKADIVYGSRFQGGQPHRVVYFWHRIGNGFLTIFSNLFTDLNLTDMETCYKVFRREVLEKIELKENRFGIEPEITSKVSRLNPTPRVYEVGISYNGRTYQEGKKISWKDGFRAIYCIFRYNIFN